MADETSGQLGKRLRLMIPCQSFAIGHPCGDSPKNNCTKGVSTLLSEVYKRVTIPFEVEWAGLVRVFNAQVFPSPSASIRIISLILQINHIYLITTLLLLSVQPRLHFLKHTNQQLHPQGILIQ